MDTETENRMNEDGRHNLSLSRDRAVFDVMAGRIRTQPDRTVEAAR
jgi:hypothetical protein